MADLWYQTPDFVRAPNISGNAELYEIENRAADPDDVVEAAMARIAPWNNMVLADIGAGTGYHIERFHQAAAHVIAIELKPALCLRLMRRLVERNLTRTSVIGASAAAIPLQNSSVEIVHARFSYFFGPGCEPGIAELGSILKPGGTAFIIDNDLQSGTFATWIQDAYDESSLDADTIESFWIAQGFSLEWLPSCWRFERQEDLERVVQLEFPTEHAAGILARHVGLEVEYNLLLVHKTYS